MFSAVAGCNMPAGPTKEADKSLLFIEENPVSGQDAKRKKRLVRSHVSKLNRQRARGQETRQLTWTTELRQPGVVPSATSAASRRSPNDMRSSSTDSSVGILNHNSEPKSHGTSSDNSEPDAQVLSLRTISPLMGALRTEAFSCAAPVDESANYCELPKLFELQNAKY